MRLLKNYFNYIKNPSATLPDLLKECSARHACLGYFMAAIGWVVFFNAGDGLSVGVLLLKLMLVFAAELTAGYFIASLAGLFLDFKKTPVSPTQLFVLVGSAGWLKGILIAGAIFSLMFPQWDLCLFAPLFLLVVLGLQLCYLTSSLRKIQPMSVGAAVSAWILGILPVGVLFALVGVFFVWGLVLLV